MIQVSEPVLEQVSEQVLEQEFDGFAPALRWEPCVGPAAPDALGLCAECGWPLEDHVADAPRHRRPERRVVAIPVRERPRLRRAS